MTSLHRSTWFDTRRFVAAVILIWTNTGEDMKVKIGISIVLLLICGSVSSSLAQSCNPAVVSYLVRDEKGNLLNQKDLQPIYEQLPKSIGDADTFLGEIALADNWQILYPARVG
jgi:hypothetical protein